MQTTVATSTRTSAARKERETFASLRDLVRQALVQSDGRWEGAEARVVEVLRDTAIWASCKEEGLPILAHALVVQSAHAYRHTALKAAAALPDVQEGTNRLRAVARASLLSYPLEGGLRLGDARKGDVEHAAEVREQQATANLRSARWLRAIAERLQGQRQVKSVLSEEDLRELAASTETV